MEKFTAKEMIGTYTTILGESPYWDSERGNLVYTDMLGKKLLMHNMENNITHEHDMKEVIGCANPMDDGRILVAIADGIHAYNPENKTYDTMWKREDYSIPSSRFNDGKCDTKGRFWVGTTDVDRNPVCALYKLDIGLEEKVENLIVSNGLVWTEDEKTMYHIDTWTKSIFKYDYDVESGEISNKQIPFIFEEDADKPDGMTIDTEGMLWIALFGSGCVRRYDPKTGEILAEIDVPVMHPTTCVFGGKDMKTLFIPSAKGQDESELAGRMFSIELPYKGFPVNKFR